MLGLIEFLFAESWSTTRKPELRKKLEVRPPKAWLKSKTRKRLPQLTHWMGRSDEPKVHRCYFAGHRRIDLRTCSKPEGEQG
jgi:hypothetical protein